MNMTKPGMLACVTAAALAAAWPAAAETAASTTAHGKTGVATAQHEDTRSMSRLTQAAQRLRETIQALAAAPAGAQRDAAMETARAALLDTQQAMIDLPPQLRAKNVSMSEAEYAKAMDKLKQAAQRLRDSAHAMATQPAGERRNEAIDQVNEALLEVNQAMVQLPWTPGEGRTHTGATSGASTSGEKAGAVSSSFDSLDRNHDGMISRSEFSQHMQR